MSPFQIWFERADGASIKLMSLGRSLAAMIQEETSNELHLYHKSHRFVIFFFAIQYYHFIHMLHAGILI